jgi:hypothetical protein
MVEIKDFQLKENSISISYIQSKKEIEKEFPLSKLKNFLMKQYSEEISEEETIDTETEEFLNDKIRTIDWDRKLKEILDFDLLSEFITKFKNDN